MAQPSSAYEPRDPTSTILYGIVRDHFETFRAHAGSLRDGEGLPRFVEQAFRDFLRCGCLAGGFARFRCAACGLDRLVAFFGLDVLACPRCGGRLRLVAVIEQASVVQRILRHVGLPTELPEPRPARAPPLRLETLEDQSRDVPELDAVW